MRHGIPRLEDVPADKRFYAGGAGSVRGYGYQRAGPLDLSNVPIGGRSSLEFGAEFRARITETIGLVPFLDAGNVYPTNLPNNGHLFYGAGLGLRQPAHRPPCESRSPQPRTAIRIRGEGYPCQSGIVATVSLENRPPGRER